MTRFTLLAIIASFFLFPLYSQEETVPITERSSSGTIRYYSGEDEYFLIDQNHSSIVRASDGKIVQKKYDNLNRIIKELAWLDTKLHYEKVFLYNAEETRAHTSITNDYILLERTNEVYTNTGLIQEKKVFTLKKKEDTENNTEANAIVITLDENKTTLISTQNFTYDSSNRLIEQKIKYENSQNLDEKIEYAFLLGNDKPDKYIYNGAVLKESLVYSSETDWVETVYFSETVYIKTIYVDTRPTLEEYFESGKKVRERKK